MTHPVATAVSRFDQLPIAPKLLEILARMSYTVPTPIQAGTIPPAMEGHDVIGIAQTGTGKTLAFALPLLQRIASDKGNALILAPTRELALQIDEVLQKVGGALGLRTAVLIGGAPMGRQIQMIQRRPHVIVATPGRCIDHLEQRTLKLDRVSVLVLDEADRMLDMGFEPQIKKVLATVPKERQTLLFSATMPEKIARIAAAYMRNPKRVEVARAGTAAELVSQKLYLVEKNDKIRLLAWLLKQPFKPVLVFSRTKHGAKRITQSLKNLGYTAAELHSNRTQGQRRLALDGFKSGEYRILVATDIAARGIDVTGIELVVNYDLPDQAEDYVHRIGRTGRAGVEGLAISFAQGDQRQELRDIERLINRRLPVEPMPSDMPVVSLKTVPYHNEMPQSGGGRRFGQSRPPSREGRTSHSGASHARPSSRFGRSRTAHKKW
ncbi:MAG: DEAD/DEAH box helicase [bacterium]|nr:DEAD/DEAH box helicase [bacterium]